VTGQECDLLCLDLPRAEAVRAALPDAAGSRVMALTAKALADPVRLRVAAALALGQELCVCDVAWIIGAPANLVSHHLRVLRRAGLVSSRRDGKLVMCQLTGHGAALLDVLSAGRRDEFPPAGHPSTERGPRQEGRTVPGRATAASGAQARPAVPGRG
jgi:DNA-binding transcriptional ArsR family regulator